MIGLVEENVTTSSRHDIIQEMETSVKTSGQMCVCVYARESIDGDDGSQFLPVHIGALGQVLG